MRVLPLILLLASCAPPPQANPEFSDSARYLFRNFDTPEPAELAFVMRALEASWIDQVDLDSADNNDRALTPTGLEDEDVAGMDVPESDPGGGLAIAVAGLSSYAPDAHTAIQLLADHTPLEPNSPTHYDRTFDGSTDACWADRACDTLRTTNSVIKENAVLSIPYSMRKDFRWVDLGLPDPSTVPAGDPIENPGDPQWAILGRSWIPSEAPNDAGEEILRTQYSLETWLPREGGAMRSLSFWFNLDGGVLTDEIKLNTARNGIDDIFIEGDAWLDANRR